METPKNRNWKVLKSEYLSSQPWFTVRREEVELPNGNRIPEYYIFEYPEWINVIAITKEQKFVFVSQYRHGLGIRIAGKNYYSKKHIDEFFGVAVDISKITQWLTAEQVEELFNMKPTALRAYTYRHKIPTKREYGRTYYSQSHLVELRRTDLMSDENYYTVEQVQQIYGLTSANICHIVKVKHIGKVKVGRKNLLLRADVERIMAERNEQP